MKIELTEEQKLKMLKAIFSEEDDNKEKEKTLDEESKNKKK